MHSIRLIPHYSPSSLCRASLFLFYAANNTAFAGSSNYNCPPGISNGFDPIQRALTIVRDEEGSKYTELERDLIEALATRSSAESKDAVDPANFAFGERSEIAPRLLARIYSMNWRIG